MPGGLPSLRWSEEPKSRRIVMVAGVEKASCLNALTSSVSQPTPEITSGKFYAHLLRLSTCGDRGVALLSTSSATTRELALDDLLTAMSAPLVASSQESLIKAWTSFHMAWFVVSDLSMIKDSQIVEGSDWLEYLVRTFRKLKRAVNRGIGPALWSAALVLGMAFKALENRSSAPVCNRGLVGPRNLFVAGCLWRLKGLKISYAEVCHLEVVVAHSWVVWTLPVSKTVVRALSRERRWECRCSGDFTKPCLFHVIVDQMKILRSSRGGEGPSPLFPTLCGGFVDKRHVVFNIEFVAKQFGGHGLHVAGVRLLVGMGISIVLLQLLTSALDMSAEEVSRQLVVFKLKAVQDKRLFHLQQEIATFEAIEDFKVMDLGYVVNTESGGAWASGMGRGCIRYTGGHIVAGLLGLVITRFRWWCRWALFCRVVWGKGTKRRNFYAV